MSLVAGRWSLVAGRWSRCALASACQQRVGWQERSAPGGGGVGGGSEVRSCSWFCVQRRGRLERLAWGSGGGGESEAREGGEGRGGVAREPARGPAPVGSGCWFAGIVQLLLHNALAVGARMLGEGSAWVRTTKDERRRRTRGTRWAGGGGGRSHLCTRRACESKGGCSGAKKSVPRGFCQVGSGLASG